MSANRLGTLALQSQNQPQMALHERSITLVDSIQIHIIESDEILSPLLW